MTDPAAEGKDTDVGAAETLAAETLPAQTLPADPAPTPSLADELRKHVGEDAVQVDAPIGELTTYRVGGNAAVLVEANSLDDLSAIHRIASSHPASKGTGTPFLVIGLGSNLLVADTGFAGVAITLGEGFTTVTVEDTQVVAGAGAKLPVVARKSGSAGLTGFEWAVGVPGSLGGAVRMNAGGHGSDMRESLVSAGLFNLNDGTSRIASPDELALGYRCSNVAAHEVVVAARLQLAVGDASAAKKQMTEIVRWRLENQPGGQNAGSVFTNPDGDSAGRLIDEAGLKGFRIGSAEVSDKHANFIQADPDGKAADVVTLMNHIVAAVEKHAGVTLHPETRMVGFAEET